MASLRCHNQTDPLPIDNKNRKGTLSQALIERDCPMPPDAAQDQPPEPDRLEAATDQAIAACGGDARAAVKALIVANEFLESEVCELMQAVSHAYTRGRFQTYTG
jgi:hypothetical protein